MEQNGEKIEGGRLRNFVFTINNPTKKDVNMLQELEYRYIVYGREIGKENKTPHLQGYCELTKQMRFAAVKKHLPRAYLAARRGTGKHAADYCKKDGDFTEFGTMKKPGERTELKKVYEMVKNGRTDIEIGETFPATYMRAYRAVDRVRMNYSRTDRCFEPVEVIVLWGDTGTGKTRKAYEIDPDLYRAANNGQWWDGYVKQQTILFDDYYGTVPYDQFLALLDGYKFQIPIKCGFTWKRWKRVIITSNEEPCYWYDKKHGFMTPALERRLKDVRHFEGGGGVNITPDTSETPLVVEENLSTSSTSETNMDDEEPVS